MSTYPNSPTSLDQPARPPDVRVIDNLEDEYVTQHGYQWANVHVLGWTIDQIEMEVGPETFEHMTRDSRIHKCKRIVINGVLTDDLVFAEGRSEAEVGPTEYKKFKMVREFCERVVAGIDRPYWKVLEQMEGGKLEQGHKIAEVVYANRMDGPMKAVSDNARPRGTKPASFLGRVFGMFRKADIETAPARERGTTITQQPKVRLMPQRVKVKPRGTVLFVVDQYMNVLGLVPSWSEGRTTFNVAEVLRRDKFLVLTHDPEDDDPRGRSAWRPAYPWWRFKQHVPRQYLRYLMQEALPIPVGILPEGAQGWLFRKGPNGKEMIDPLTQKPVYLEATTSMKLTIQEMVGGKAVVLPHGADIKAYTGKGAQGDEVYPKALTTINGEIEDSILLQLLGQSEGEHQARSAAQVHADVRGDLFFWEKRDICTMTLYDLCAPCVRENLGEWALPYMPKLSLGDSEKRDWAKDLETVAKAYFYGFIDDTMRAELCAWLSLPKPGLSRFEMTGEDSTATVDAKGEPVNPNSNRPDKQPGNDGRNDGNSTPKQAQLEAMMIQMRKLVALAEQQGQPNTGANDASFNESRLFAVGHHQKGRSAFIQHLS